MLYNYIDNENSESRYDNMSVFIFIIMWFKRHSSQSLCSSGPSGSGATCITPSPQELDVTPSGQPQTKKRKMIRADEVDDAMLLYMKEQSEERAKRKERRQTKTTLEGMWQHLLRGFLIVPGQGTIEDRRSSCER